MIVKHERLRCGKTPLHLELYVDATDCPSDLGGLEIRQSFQFNEKRREVKDLLKHIGRTAPDQIDALRVADLAGRVLGGWQGLRIATTHLPIAGSVSYEKRTKLAESLNSLPGFRKKLLTKVKKTPCPFGKMKLNSN